MTAEYHIFTTHLIDPPVDGLCVACCGAGQICGMDPLRSGSWLTSGLFCIFGISSWVTVNGIFAQLPVLAAVQPEGWTLGSHLGLAVQLANVGPALYIGLRRCTQQHAVSVSTTIYAILSCSLLSMLGLV